MRRRLVREAKKHAIALRQSYQRLGKKALARQGRYAHARQGKRAARETRRLKTCLGRVLRDLKRKAGAGAAELERLLSLAGRIHTRQKHDKRKVYSVQAPEVECTAKGKAHKEVRVRLQGWGGEHLKRETGSPASRTTTGTPTTAGP